MTDINIAAAARQSGVRNYRRRVLTFTQAAEMVADWKREGRVDTAEEAAWRVRCPDIAPLGDGYGVSDRSLFYSITRNSVPIASIHRAHRGLTRYSVQCNVPIPWIKAHTPVESHAAKEARRQHRAYVFMYGDTAYTYGNCPHYQDMPTPTHALTREEYLQAHANKSDNMPGSARTRWLRLLSCLADEIASTCSMFGHVAVHYRRPQGLTLSDSSLHALRPTMLAEIYLRAPWLHASNALHVSVVGGLTAWPEAQMPIAIVRFPGGRASGARSLLGDSFGDFAEKWCQFGDGILAMGDIDTVMPAVREWCAAGIEIPM